MKVATANRLDDGAVVYLAADGVWSLDIDDSRVAKDDAAAAALEADAVGPDQTCAVVGVYMVDVAPSEEGLRPLRYKERIRAYGPTTHPTFSRKHVASHYEPQTDVASVFLNGI